MNVRKARAWGTFWTGMTFLLIVVIVGVLTMVKCDYNGHILPKIPEHEGYDNSVIVGLTWVEDGVESVARYVLFLSDSFPTVRDVDGVPTLTWPGGDDVNYICYDYVPEDDSDWQEQDSFDDDSGDNWHITVDHRWIWSNVDIHDEDGNLVYEAADPTEVVPEPEKKSFCLRSWLTGYALGLAGKPLTVPPTQPTAYSYNGVVLPGLPEWDETVYPYAVIAMDRKDNPAYITLYASENPLFAQRTGGNCIPRDTKYKDWTMYDISSKEWGNPLDMQTYAGALDTGLDFYVWSNYDYLYEDGELYHYKSTPTPVYE